MRSLGRFVLACAFFVSATAGLRAQDPDAQPAPPVIPSAAPATADSPEPPVESVVAPAGEPALAVEETAADAPAGPPPSAGEPSSVPAAVDVAPLPAPAAVTLDQAVFSRAADEEPVRGRRSSDWVFLGIVALAVVVILAKLTREQPATVSIRDETIGGFSQPPAQGPPIVRRP